MREESIYRPFYYHLPVLKLEKQIQSVCSSLSVLIGRGKGVVKQKVERQNVCHLTKDIDKSCKIYKERRNYMT